MTGQLYSTRKYMSDYKKYREDIRNLTDVKGLGAQTVYPEIGRYMATGETKETKKSIQIRKQISRNTEHQLGLLAEELKFIEMQNKGYNKSIIAQEKLNSFLRKKVKLYNTTDRVISGEIEGLNEQEIISLALAGNYEEILNLSKGTAITEKSILEIEKMKNIIASENGKIAKKSLEILIQHETNLLKTKKATNLQVLESTIEMEKQLGINQDALSLLKNQLDLEIAIKKEKEAQTKLSSNTLKLYEISQKEGLMAAKQIGEFLQGRMTYQALQTREVFGTFKEYFPQIEKTMKALQFFKRGIGRGIPIEEEAIRQQSWQRPGIGIKRRAEAQLPEAAKIPPKVDINTQIAQIEVTLPEGSLENMAEHVGKTVKEFLLTNEKYQKDLMGKLRKYA
jgi:hypothetical protein